MAMGEEKFFQNSALIRQEFPTLTRPTGGGLVSMVLPRTGLLKGIFLRIAVTVAGSLSAPNALGISSAIKSVNIRTNAATDLFSVSGPGYAYLLNEMLESEYFLAQVQNQGRTAVTATSFNLDMYIPIGLNLATALGFFMLQSEGTQVTLEANWEADAIVATGATVTGTIIPSLYFHTVPANQENWPKTLRVLHQIIEQPTPIAATGDNDYQVPKGGTILQLGAMLGAGASGSDLFSRVRERVNTSTYLTDLTPGAGLNQDHALLRGRTRPAGTFIIDKVGEMGLGNYGDISQGFDTNKVTDYALVVTATGTGTMRVIRRQLIGAGA